MTKYPLFLTILSAGLFFFFATATSYDEPIIPEHVAELVVELTDSTLILSNEDTLDFFDVRMDLTYFDRYDFRTDGIKDSIYEGGSIYDYSIEMGEIDTISFSDFIDQDSLSYPVDSIPDFFHFESQIGFRAIFSHEF